MTAKNIHPAYSQMLHRRAFLGRSALGFGASALATLLPTTPTLLGDESERRLGLPHHPPRVKRVIFLYMSGGPSHLETFDYKRDLERLNDQPMPESFTAGQLIAQLQGQKLKCLGPQFKFSRCGQSGQEISDILPHTQKIADQICIIRSMQTDQINHDPAHTVMNTGTSISGRPSMGSWITYGLGSECENLPGFIVLTSFGGRNPQPISQRQWGSGFLPGEFQGVEFYSKGAAVHYIENPAGTHRDQQRGLIQSINQLNRLSPIASSDPQTSARIAQLEMAFQMQTSVPELMDIRDETPETLAHYGCQGADGSFAYNCLLARRLAERGVRFIQLYHRDWDHHGDLVHYMNICCGLCDRPTAALLEDLRQRGLLEDTLIIWGGEFGRTPMFQGKGKTAGRDHHIKGFSMWLAGGAVRGGTSYGETDELGYNAVKDVVHVRDLHATILHLLGINHERFSIPYQGLDLRLTGVEPARVLHPLLS
jgi:hypothetical protein